MSDYGTCTICGRKLERGRLLANPDRCDSCANVQRDGHNFPWEPGEEVKKYMDIKTGEITIVRREDAMRK